MKRKEEEEEERKKERKKERKPGGEARRPSQHLLVKKRGKRLKLEFSHRQLGIVDLERVHTHLEKRHCCVYVIGLSGVKKKKLKNQLSWSEVE